ncbi:hypothetical protein C1883_20750 [Pseudomonas protegens]|nr:hypothetical protein C1883_20750 [Pseudomonas protegens]
MDKLFHGSGIGGALRLIQLAHSGIFKALAGSVLTPPDGMHIGVAPWSQFQAVGQFHRGAAG